MGCVATVRGALDKVAGVTGVDVQAGQRDMKVRYRAAEVDLQQILAALAAAGESATAK